MNNSRQTNNILILKEIEDYIIKNPDQRFGQVIRNLGIVDTIIRKQENKSQVYFTNIFYEEPEVTLNKIINTRKRDGI